MSKFNDAELHAIKELNPVGYSRWQIPDLDEDLEWYTWLETQVSPPPGVPFLRCDCVAAFRSRSGTQAPWACLIEAQAQPIPRLAVWILVYLGLLHEDLRHGPHDRDRFQMMGAILNLTDTTLSTNIDWIPPLKASSLQSVPPGVRCRFWVRNVREEKAEETLDQIAAGRTALCILVWVPLMIGADQPAVLRRWLELVPREDKPHVRADYVALARTFAELAGREALWFPALEKIDMKDSTFLQQVEDRGIEKGQLIGRIRLLQQLLQQPETASEELKRLPEENLTQLAESLNRQLLGKKDANGTAATDKA